MVSLDRRENPSCRRGSRGLTTSVPNITGAAVLPQARFFQYISQVLLVPRIDRVTPGKEKLVLYNSFSLIKRRSTADSKGLPARNFVQVQLVHGKGSRDQSPFRNELCWEPRPCNHGSRTGPWHRRALWRLEYHVRDKAGPWSDR